MQSRKCVMLMYLYLTCSFPEERDAAGEADGSDHRNNMESVKRDHRMEIQTIISDFSTAQTRLQARIVALETEYLLLPHQ